ncbi:MAG: hypothetical protein A2Z91_00530 [Deltaproteobacteria bacterium GWA2_38_16]|nr:MAG: hypothetical protein A2Z91_00530 [Deltaproteobacteria bacterium GWA2_38_16]OGQ03586.1 MAG: hypothetical protein A3D19_01935 [Deltaproteobacteria bacterium RIFCSPHIGHO2_02_FULL_38_15]OGQ30164.1 MAG: hypothetical protein A3A72_01555 [Deltaproteobacteria bacterium RIFCSPLOWO2_01_FULL_38_9]OGQ64041.1 MAG: hypothetical protein A3G92_01200 [Deltaproteobacteria bacterium RIFCSPLOWO2_12_FULL_38_8]
MELALLSIKKLIYVKIVSEKWANSFAIVFSLQVKIKNREENCMKIVTLLFVSVFFVFSGVVYGAGADLYKGKCASCHGKAGEGSAALAKMLKVDNAKLALNSATTQKLSNAELLKVTSDGRGKMPAYKGKLKDDELKQLVDFIRTLKK